MLMGALAVFTLVAVMGVAVLPGIWRGYPVDPFYPVLHGIAALLGSGLVIVAALGGDQRVYLNIGLAVVIIGLGATMGILSKNGKKIPKFILVSHIGLALVCYGILAYFTLNPNATLI